MPASRRPTTWKEEPPLPALHRRISLSKQKRISSAQRQRFASLELDPDDFVYADPPYDVEFTQYSKESFDWKDQVRLAESLAVHPGPVVLSNQATDRIVRLYKSLGFALRFLDAPRRISCNGDRTPVREVLAVKNL